MLKQVILILILSTSIYSLCFADEAPSQDMVVCMDNEDRSPCRWTDYSGILRTGNCFDQICVPHCPESAEEGSVCTFIIGSGEERQGTCEEGSCNNLMEVAGGIESSAGDVEGGQSLSDFLGGADTQANNEDRVEDGNPSETSESEDEGCQQRSSKQGMTPLFMLCLISIVLFKRRRQLH